MLFISLILVSCSSVASAQNKNDPLSEWAVEEGYSLKIAASGLQLPTAIAIIKNPKPDPKAPRMFVTELRGEIKVIANDFTVSSFANIVTFKPAAEWPGKVGEAGMAGLCIDDEHGYVFVTYAYRDQLGLLRNGISRFSSTPRTFEAGAAERQDFLDLFKDDVSALSHQIGGCVVDGDSVYVGVGDGGDPASSRLRDKMLGKLIRLTLDGKPHPSNPFASEGSKPAAIYAYGMRNPFGLAVVNNRLFVAENGVDLDRFMEIERGRDYGWDGTDASISINAAVVFSPTICPVQLAYASTEQNVLPRSTNGRFLIAGSNSKAHNPGIISVEYDLLKKVVLEGPKYLVNFESQNPGQGVVGIAIGTDGIYFCPILPVGNSGVVMVLRYDPAQAHSRIIGRGSRPVELIHRFGCLKCHSLDGVGGTQGPNLDRNSLRTRAESRVLDPSYKKLIDRVEAIPDKSIQESSHARREVLAAKSNDRVRLWVINRMLHPRFDEPNAQMPKLNLTREQAEAITSYLLNESPEPPPTALGLFSSRRFWGGVCLGLLIGSLLTSAFVIRLKSRDRTHKN
jgi:glucose/arabinose dehydrogenase